MVRAIQKQVDARPVLGQTRFDVLVHTSNVVDPVQAPRDPGLVGHHCDWDAGPIEPGNRLRRPFDELDPVDRADVSVVNDYRAVAIKKDAGPQMRARWRTSICSVRRATCRREPRQGAPQPPDPRRQDRPLEPSPRHLTWFARAGDRPGHKSVQPAAVIRRTLQRRGLGRVLAGPANTKSQHGITSRCSSPCSGRAPKDQGQVRLPYHGGPLSARMYIGT